MIDLTKLVTETRNPNTMDLDQMTPLELVSVMNQEDLNVVAGVKEVLPQVAQAIEWAVSSLEAGGRIVYFGAGTSGRLGVLDAVECPPTFGVSPDVVVGLIAGGEKAFVRAVEGAEDSLELCEEEFKKIGLNKNDIAIGIAASGRTPYVIGGLLVLWAARPLQLPAIRALRWAKRQSLLLSLPVVLRFLQVPRALSLVPLRR
mgnify:CR=1 FL=1